MVIAANTVLRYGIYVDIFSCTIISKRFEQLLCKIARENNYFLNNTLTKHSHIVNSKITSNSMTASSAVVSVSMQLQPKPRFTSLEASHSSMLATYTHILLSSGVHDNNF